MSMQSPPPPRPTRSTIVLGVIAMQCGQKTRNCEVLFFFVWREGQGGGWRIFEKKKGKKKKGKVGGRERTRDEGEQETNKKKQISRSLCFFPPPALFSLREKRKKRHEMNHVRLHKLFSQYSSARARAYILSLFDTI